MAGIGEASAVIGVAQVGLSLASALNTYISDVSNARDDILSLIGDIEATSRQLADLQQLITRNETTKAWNENGLRNAQKCVTDCEKTIAKLRKLLRKSSISNSDSEPVGEVNRDEIDITKFRQAMWPWYKPQLEVYRRELQGAKQDILIAYSTYMIKTGTSAEREKYKGDLPQLHRARELIRGQLREAKASRWRREVDFSGKPVLMNEPRRRARFREPSRDSSRGSSSGDWIYTLPDGSSEPDPAEVKKFVDFFEQWQVEKEEDLKMKEEKRKEIENKAVERFKTQQLLALKARRQKVEEARAKLLTELTKAQMPPQQANEIVNNIHPLDTIDKDLQIFRTTSAEERALNTKPTTSVMTDGVQSVSSRRWTLWPRRSGAERSFSAASKLGHGLQKEDIPPLLQDPTSNGGIAPLEAYFFQRTNRHYVPRVEMIDFEVPNQWLLRSIIKKQDDLVTTPAKSHSVWREFSLLPGDYREEIAKYLDSKNTQHEFSKWVLLHVEPLWEERRRSIFHRRAKSEDISGVYVVFKQNRRRFNPLRRQQLFQRYEPPSDIAETLGEISNSSSTSLSDGDDRENWLFSGLDETEEQLRQKIINKYVDLGEPKAADSSPQPANEDHDETLLASPESNHSARKEG
ncbi:hypothetical protein DTO271D3_4620 [Paecilomyces variotii]|nr:hypothetical protein DTO169E5_7047 [Paecilomyces variotii]KAJ9298089.1 hypothetical protein DTO217A2_8475 [Paecilomyces variotii]KAJ9315167.1 hypothetical protein DTO271D3_4620 [Paecilomyces variotii]